jgi:hypothetical protein
MMIRNLPASVGWTSLPPTLIQLCEPEPCVSPKKKTTMSEMITGDKGGHRQQRKLAVVEHRYHKERNQPDADKLHLQQPIIRQRGRVVRGAEDHRDADATQAPAPPPAAANQSDAS